MKREVDCDSVEEPRVEGGAESEERLDALALCDEATWRQVDADTRRSLELFVRCQGLASADVDEVVNECYAHLYRAVLQRRRIQSISGYLKGIARFVVYRKIRERVSRRAHEADMPEPLEVGGVDAPADVQRQLALELRVDVRTALERLGEYERRVLILSATRPSQKEVAAELGVSYPKLRKDLHQARKAFRVVLELESDRRAVREAPAEAELPGSSQKRETNSEVSATD